MNWKALLALNFDLLLQYPIHRLPKNGKLLRSLDADRDRLLVTEETLVNEAFDIIELLSTAPDDLQLSNAQESAKTRLHYLLPLLLYRYRLPSTRELVESGSKTTKSRATISGIDDNDESEAAAELQDGDQTLQILAFNFRPFGTSDCYINWPIGRTEAVAVDASADITTQKQPVYVVEPVDRLVWLRSKRSMLHNADFDVARIYGDIELYFKKYAPRARALRKARFRSMQAETDAFRKLIFDAPVYSDPAMTPLWDYLWNDALNAFYKGKNNDFIDSTSRVKQRHMVANLLVLLQPSSVHVAVHQFQCFNALMAAATAWWPEESIALLEGLVRATVYDVATTAAPHIDRKNCVLRALVDTLTTEKTPAQQIVTLRATTLHFYCALRSQFSEVFCGNSTGSAAQTVIMLDNTFVRTLATLEQRIDPSLETTYFTGTKLWSLAESMIRFLRENVLDVQLTSIDFVAQFAKQIGDENAKQSLQLSDQQATVRTTLVGNIGPTKIR